MTERPTNQPADKPTTYVSKIKAKRQLDRMKRVMQSNKERYILILLKSIFLVVVFSFSPKYGTATI